MKKAGREARPLKLFHVGCGQPTISVPENQ
jgi:hypothetical protein